LIVYLKFIFLAFGLEKSEGWKVQSGKKKGAER